MMQSEYQKESEDRIEMAAEADNTKGAGKENKKPAKTSGKTAVGETVKNAGTEQQQETGAPNQACRLTEELPVYLL